MRSTARFLVIAAAVCLGAGCSNNENLAELPGGESEIDAGVGEAGSADSLKAADMLTIDTGANGDAMETGIDAGGADAALDSAGPWDSARASDSAGVTCSTCGIDAPMDVSSVLDTARLTDSAGLDDAGADGEGMVCSLACPVGTRCCDGTDPRCDGTKVPAGDSTNPGQFVVSADGQMVTDTITGLVWQREGTGARPGCSGATACTWGEAQTYCADLSLGGFTDWRLPHVKELRSIVDFTQDPVALDPVAFPHTAYGYFYWTADPSSESVDNAWGVLFGNGSYSLFRRIDQWNVRCVRGSRCAPTVRFVVEGGLVRDTLTQRVWQRDAAGPRTGCTGTDTRTCTWDEAHAYCENLVVDGFDDFRLPTTRELDSLVDFSVPPMGPTIDATAFPDTPTDPSTDAFWSSTMIDEEAWRTYFYNGETLGEPLTSYARVRCIR